jgi:hypothetical protein
LTTSGKSGNLWFFRDQANLEIDFIYEEAHNLTLYECKWTSTPTSAMTSSLTKVKSIFETQAANKISVTRSALISRSQDELTVGAIDYCSPWTGLLIHV